MPLIGRTHAGHPIGWCRWAKSSTNLKLGVLYHQIRGSCPTTPIHCPSPAARAALRHEKTGTGRGAALAAPGGSHRVRRRHPAAGTHQLVTTVTVSELRNPAAAGPGPGPWRSGNLTGITS
eukprot:756579-Hanusia_phi.AAC.1